MKSVSILALGALALSGCSIFVPYDSEFSCPGTTDYGKCISVQGAYSEALGGTVEAESVASKVKDGDKHDDEGEAVSHAKRDYGPPPVPNTREAKAAARAVNRYKAAEYDKLAKTIEDPITPVVEPPKTLRTLIVARATSDQRLYMPRYIFFFASDGKFVLGDYLSRERAKGEQTLYPNGAANIDGVMRK